MTANDTQTLMARETAEAPAVVARLLAANEAACMALGEKLRQAPPRVVVTCARGSSDHAATYAKYLIETATGSIVSSIAPSVTSIYHARQSMHDALFIAISQSGKSPDLVDNARAAKESGALVVTVVNDTASPLADLADVCLPVHAGAEKSVAATKSYIASLAAVLQLVTHWSQDAALHQALADLPGQLAEAVKLDWRPAVPLLTTVSNMLVVGRGIGLGIAQEAALKLKETSAIHAEGFSAAELMYGPLGLIRPDFPVLVFSQADETRQSVRDLVATLRSKGAAVFFAEEGDAESGRLPVIAGMHPMAAPLGVIQTFYGLANDLSLARGRNPDAPPHLKKVTETR